MARLQKKKPVSEKKKERVAAESTTNLSATTSGSAKPKSVNLPGASKAKPGKKLVEAKSGEPNFFQKSMEFFREVKVELKKVTWPTRKQTTGTTIVVIIFVFVIAAFLGFFDYSLSKLVQVVLT